MYSSKGKFACDHVLSSYMKSKTKLNLADISFKSHVELAMKIHKPNYITYRKKLYLDFCFLSPISGNAERERERESGILYENSGGDWTFGRQS